LAFSQGLLTLALSINYIKRYGADVGTLIYDFTRLVEVSCGKGVNVVGVRITARSVEYQRLLEPG